MLLTYKGARDMDMDESPELTADMRSVLLRREADIARMKPRDVGLPSASMSVQESQEIAAVRPPV